MALQPWGWGAAVSGWNGASSAWPVGLPPRRGLPLGLAAATPDAAVRGPQAEGREGGESCFCQESARPTASVRPRRLGPGHPASPEPRPSWDPGVHPKRETGGGPRASRCGCSPPPAESGWPGGPVRAAVQGPTPPPSSLPERSAADAMGTGRTRVDRGVKERGARAPRGTTLPGARTGRPAPPARHGVRSTGPAWRTRGEKRGRTRGRAPGTARRHAERPRPALQRGKWPGRGAVRTREAAGHGVRAAAGAVGGGS